MIRACRNHAEYAALLREAVAQAENKSGLIAVICQNRRSLRRVRELLGESAPPLIRGDEKLPAQGVFLIELQYAKGLEFDEVILPDADERTCPVSEEKRLLTRHRLYTAISRATKKITILSDGKLTPLLPGTAGSAEPGSGCDVSAALAAKFDIRIVPLTIHYHDRAYTDTELEQSNPLYVYRHFDEEVPKTAAINAAEVLDVIEAAHADGYENFICVAISGAMSSTFQSMHMALGEYREEHPQSKVYAFDTKNISMGSGIFAVYAARELAAGRDFDSLTKALESKIYDVRLGYYMNTLDYLKKGGRITPSVALVGKILNIKPIISCTREGTDVSKCWIVILNGDGKAGAEQAKKLILERFPEANIIEEKQIVSSLAIHTGPGLVGIVAFDLGGAVQLDPVQQHLENLEQKAAKVADTISYTNEKIGERLNQRK